MGNQRRDTLVNRVLLATLLVAFALRLFRLDFQALWWDEGDTVYFATQSLSALTSATAADIHPPLYYYLLHFWMQPAGPGAFSVRFFSALVGMLAIPLFYQLGRKLVPGRDSLLAALLLAISPFHVYYSQEARMYALATLWAVLSGYFMLRLVEDAQRSEGRGQGAGSRGQGAAGCYLLAASWWLGYVLTTVAALYTIYYAAFLLVFQTLFVFIYHRRHRALWQKWVAGQVVVVLLYLPWLAYVALQLTAYVTGKVSIERYVPLNLFQFFGQCLAAFGMGIPSAGRQPWLWLAVVPGLLAVLGAQVGRDRSRRPATGFLLLYLLVPIALGFLINLWFPFAPVGFPRLFLYSLPAYLLLCAQGLAWLAPQSEQRCGGAEVQGRVSPAPPFPRPSAPLLLFAGLAALLVALSGAALYDFYTEVRYPKEGYRRLIATMSALGRPEDEVLCLYPWQVGYLKSYYRGALPTLYHPSLGTQDQWAKDAASMQVDLDYAFLTSKRLWFPAYQVKGRILEDQIEAYLARQGFPALNQWYDNTKLLLFTAGPPLVERPAQVNFGDLVLLSGYGLDPGPLEAGVDAARAALTWHVDRPPSSEESLESLTVSLRLVDQAGQVWAQRDSVPVGGLLPFNKWPPGSTGQDRHGLLVPAGTPPGDYLLELRLWSRRFPHGLGIQGVLGRPPELAYSLGVVRVVRPEASLPLGSLAMEKIIGADFGAFVRLLGYTVGTRETSPGKKLAVTIYWQALSKMDLSYNVTVQLLDRQGKLWGLSEGPAVAGRHPTSAWWPGEYVKDQYYIVVPADAPSGQYLLKVGWYNPASGQRLLVRGRDSVDLDTVSILARQHVMAAPPIPHPTSFRLGESFQLLGYALDRDSLRAGEELRLVLYWRDIKRTSRAYTVFAHLVDGQDRIWGQKDSEPAGGQAPTTSWVENEIIQDEYAIMVKPETAPGEYQLAVGMYDPVNWARLPVFDTSGQALGDRVPLTRIRVVR